MKKNEEACQDTVRRNGGTSGHRLAMALFSDVSREQANLLGDHLFQPLASYPASFSLTAR